ncbi:phosphoinositide phosphatase SAC2-like isoform X2 [Diospyros lotus]|uniref:phosphoinositide phosphatase SAC2-like isoform X2 n=1 Tax=Diospyros lotus TaxID=55363 RepID=UPI002251C2D1|nr:phosphoinositide phosphatase SAC2-like isoform X2 [Diospyros lotus]
MASDNGQQAWIEVEGPKIPPYLRKFKLYETNSNFYMIGCDKKRNVWRLLKIDRVEPSELNMFEDGTIYSEIECSDLLRRIHEGNKSTGGIKFVTTCYGIVGFIKFLGPYYMLIITKRRKIGSICGHGVYAIAKSEMIPVPNSTVLSNMDCSKDENRYKKLLNSMDLTKDFFFSYSYHVMHSLQKNFCNHETGHILYETMFVWNEFLTRRIRNHLGNTLWTVALVYGFFKQVKLSISGREFNLALIARRSRHYAGTRYLKRGVNEKGRVANDVETEQIVFEDVPEGCPVQISSIVQNRGSIPLFWSQETSRLNIKPDIILEKKDRNYHATRLHFENLVERYGNPIIILNLIKTNEKKPRESILRAEFAKAIDIINKDLTGQNRLMFLHWDLNKQARNKAIDVLPLLGKVAANALNLTGFFYYHVVPTSCTNELLNLSNFENNDNGTCCVWNIYYSKKDADAETGDNSNKTNANENHLKPPMFQKGVLRTNCIDCLDRTNVAQYAYGWVALGNQLHALGYVDNPIIDMRSPLAKDLMGMYERMGDTLALQYGGSAAHNKIFSQSRGQWKAATQSQEFFRTLQRYYNNAYTDAEKQYAINVFLGHFQPEQDKPALWELNSDQHYNIGSQEYNITDENARVFKRSLSDGDIACESNSPIETLDVGQNEDRDQILLDNTRGGNKGLSESTPEISTCESELSYPRYTASMSTRQPFPDVQPDQCLQSDAISVDEHRDLFDWSNFLDVDDLSSCGNSCEDDLYDRSAIISTSMDGGSSDGHVSGLRMESSASASESMSSMRNTNSLVQYSDRFANWVDRGDTLFL